MSDPRSDKDLNDSSSDPVPPTPRRGWAYPKAMERLLDEFAALPGIGRRSAERLAFHVLKASHDEAMRLARAIEAVKATVRHCRICWNLSDDDVCTICGDPSRDRGIILVVEQPKDLIALEQTGMYRGLYHVLMGRISPLEGVGVKELTISSLETRVIRASENAGGTPVAEVILGFNPTLEGDGTAMVVADLLRTRGVRVSRLARGLPTGSTLEHANKAVLTDAIQGRQRVE